MSYFDIFPKEVFGILREHEILGISFCGKNLCPRNLYCPFDLNRSDGVVEDLSRRRVVQFKIPLSPLFKEHNCV